MARFVTVSVYRKCSWESLLISVDIGSRWNFLPMFDQLLSVGILLFEIIGIVNSIYYSFVLALNLLYLLLQVKKLLVQMGYLLCPSLVSLLIESEGGSQASCIARFWDLASLLEVLIHLKCYKFINSAISAPKL